MSSDVSVHLLMDRIEALDSEVGLSFGWFFLMTHGHWVDSDIGMAIAQGLKAQRIRLPDPDARVLLRWRIEATAFDGAVHGRSQVDFMKADSAQFKKVDRGQLWPVSRASWPEQTDEGAGTSNLPS